MHQVTSDDHIKAATNNSVQNKHSSQFPRIQSDMFKMLLLSSQQSKTQRHADEREAVFPCQGWQI